MLKVRILPSILLLLISVFSVENASAQSMCRELFAISVQSQKTLSLISALKRSKIYEDGFCSTNVFRLIAQMELKKINIDSAEVLFFIPTTGKDVLLNPLRFYGEENEWDFHTVLFYEGKIFDFDFDGALLSPKQYFREMFGVSEVEDHGILVRAIPARDFLQDYRDHREIDYTELYRTNNPLLGTIHDFQWYIEDAASYPIMPINDVESFLSRF